MMLLHPTLSTVLPATNNDCQHAQVLSKQQQQYCSNSCQVQCSALL